ncbi:MAG: hypothetical protein J5I65_14940 [Aridibacter famidurans]|nr:hypothetical protein [Aridibacter famidurans]
MNIDLENLTEEELVELNHLIVERLRFLKQTRAHKAMMRFRIGQKVSFDPGDRQTVTGTLTKFNKKTVTVITDDGYRWNVAPGFLRDANAEKAVSGKNKNVIDFKKSR